MPPLSELLVAAAYNLGIPAAVAAGILLATRHLRARWGETADGLAAGVAVALGFWVGFDFLGLNPKPETDTWGRLPRLLALVVAVDLLRFVPRLRPSLLPFARAGAAVAAALVLVPHLPALKESRPLWILGLAVAIHLLTTLPEEYAATRPGSLYPALLGATALAAAVLLQLAAIMTFAQVTGVLVGVALGLTAVAAWPPPRPLGRALLPAVGLLVPGLLALGYLYSFSDLPWWCYALVAAAPLGPWAVSLLAPVTPKLRGGWLQVASAAATLLPLAAALGAALWLGGLPF